MVRVKILSVLLFTITTHAIAQLGCKDPQVVLTLREVPCKQEIVLPEEFDIPELEINFDNIDLIFEKENEEALGADSSGGGRITPMDNGRFGAEFNTSLNYSCVATLTSDGEKQYQVVSKERFDLNHISVSKYLFFQNHFLNDRNEPEILYPIPMPPTNLNTSGYFFRFENPNRETGLPETQIKISLCRLNQAAGNQSINICTDSSVDIDSSKLGLSLSTQKISSDQKLTVTQKIDVTCLNNN